MLNRLWFGFFLVAAAASIAHLLRLSEGGGREARQRPSNEIAINFDQQGCRKTSMLA